MRQLASPGSMTLRGLLLDTTAHDQIYEFSTRVTSFDVYFSTVYTLLKKDMSSNLSHDRAFRALQERDGDCDTGRIPSKQHSVKFKGDKSGGEDFSIRLRIVQIRVLRPTLFCLRRKIDNGAFLANLCYLDY